MLTTWHTFRHMLSESFVGKQGVPCMGASGWSSRIMSARGEKVKTSSLRRSHEQEPHMEERQFFLGDIGCLYESALC